MFTYDQLNRVKQLATSQTGYLYTFDAVGNRKSGAELSNRTTNWTYDGIYRLTNETISLDPANKNGSVGYGLDPVGNRTSETSSLSGVNSGSFSFNLDDEFAGESYDSNGNVIASGGKTFGYDTENHLTSMNGGAVTIVYDGDGNRVAKTVNGVTTQYLVDDLNPTGYPQVVEELQGGVVARQYTYGLERISEAQSVNGTWTPSFYGYDGFGTVRQLTNSASAITDTYDYDAFGTKINSTGTTPNNYLYRGEQWDSDLGLYYLRARYYNPITGRFMSRDPEDGDVTDPATLHKYVYANDDPVDLSDPTGRAAASSYARVNFTISVAPVVIRGLQATAVAIACADLWIGSKTYAETVAGPFGTVEMVAPCLWMGKKPRGHSDPIPWPGNPCPGPNPNEPGKCNPCPPPSPYWSQPGNVHGGTGGFHFHWWAWGQKPYPDCTCYPKRMDGGDPPDGGTPYTPGGPAWP